MVAGHCNKVREEEVEKGSPMDQSSDKEGETSNRDKKCVAFVFLESTSVVKVLELVNVKVCSWKEKAVSCWQEQGKIKIIRRKEMDANRDWQIKGGPEKRKKWSHVAFEWSGADRPKFSPSLDHWSLDSRSLVPRGSEILEIWPYSPRDSSVPRRGQSVHSEIVCRCGRGRRRAKLKFEASFS